MYPMPTFVPAIHPNLMSLPDDQPVRLMISCTMPVTLIVLWPVVVGVKLVLAAVCAIWSGRAS